MDHLKQPWKKTVLHHIIYYSIFFFVSVCPLVPFCSSWISLMADDVYSIFKENSMHFGWVFQTVKVHPCPWNLWTYPTLGLLEVLFSSVDFMALMPRYLHLIIIIIIAFKGAIRDFLTISSQRRELCPIRTLKWPGRNRVQITCNTSSAYHVQVSCYVPLCTKGQLSY